MKAIVYEAFSAPPQLKSVPDPTPEAHGVAIKVQAAIDISDEKLAVARGMGAIATVNATQVANVVEAVTNITKGGVHVSLDALGHPSTCLNSISNLRRRGKHIQVGLMLAENSTPAIPMAKVIAHELEILRSHGMQAHRYGAMLDMVQTGKLTPEKNLSARGSIWSNRLMR